MDSFTSKVAAWVGLGLGIVAVSMLVFSAPAQVALNANFGTTSNVGHEEVIPWGFGNGFQLGPPSTGPVLKMIAVATCNPTISSLPLAATTTAKATCTLGNNYNFATSDIIQVGLPSNPVAYGAIVATGGSVTTGGQGPTITFSYENLAGVATSSFPLATTSVSIEAFRLF